MNQSPETTAPIIPPGKLPPLGVQDLPEPIPLRRMIGPGIILAGLALGSGEFILWPYITYKTGFVFFWACLLGVATQYFLNTEIIRYTLATGESTTTGFIRLWRGWAGIFLILNILPWMLPGWAKGAAQLLSWLIWGPTFTDEGKIVTAYETPLAIAGMFLCGMILTAGPVLYETLEKIQIVLVSLVIVMVIALTCWLVKDRPDAIFAQVTATATLGAPQFIPDLAASGLTPVMLLGALAFAGAGGTTNLGESNYVKDKGYGMGHWIGRITSPITGQEEAVSEIGSTFTHDPGNLVRWQIWWRRSCTEHFLSFFCTCFLCLVLLTLVSYVLFFEPDGSRIDEATKFEHGIGFVWGEAQLLADKIGSSGKILFLVMGVAILLTTEFGVLDVTSRISTDIVKTAWLNDNQWWTASKLYYVFLWASIFLGTAILLLQTIGIDVGALTLLTASAAMNGLVMFLYSITLLVLNTRRLPPGIRPNLARVAILVWSILFFGLFSIWAIYDKLGALAWLFKEPSKTLVP